MPKTQDTIELGLNGAPKRQVLLSRRRRHAGEFNSGLTARCGFFFFLQSEGLGKQRQGATVSFHNIHYQVTQGGGCLRRRKATIKDILVDLR